MYDQFEVNSRKSALPSVISIFIFDDDFMDKTCAIIYVINKNRKSTNIKTSDIAGENYE